MNIRAILDAAEMTAWRLAWSDCQDRLAEDGLPHVNTAGVNIDDVAPDVDSKWRTEWRFKFESEKTGRVILGCHEKLFAFLANVDTHSLALSEDVAIVSALALDSRILGFYLVMEALESGVSLSDSHPGCADWTDVSNAIRRLHTPGDAGAAGQLLPLIELPEFDGEDGDGD